MQIKPYEPMGYLITHGNEPKIYSLPMKTVDQIMEAINSPEAPKYINLTRFGYGRESASMIRGADNYDNMTGEVERMILQLENDMREDVKKFIAERKDRKQVIKKQIIEQYIAELQEKTL